MNRWYVVNTQSHQEARADENLRRQGFYSWLPRFRRPRKHARRTDYVSAPLFPGYLFVRLDPEAERWRSINGTFGVVASACATATHRSPSPTGWWRRSCGAATDPASLCCRRAASPLGKPSESRLDRSPILKVCSRKCWGGIVLSCSSICSAARFGRACRWQDWRLEVQTFGSPGVCWDMSGWVRFHPSCGSI